MATSVGFIGVGNMGNPMAGNVLKAFPLTVFDKNPNAMSNLIAAGAQKAGSHQEVLERAEIVMTCLPASPDVEALYLDAGGLVERAKPGTILIDLSSVLPSTPRKIEPRAKQRGVHFLEAPVSGGVSGAKAATLAVMVGGDAAVLERARSEYLQRRSGGRGQHREGDQQHDGVRQLAGHDGRPRARPEGGPGPDDDLRGRQGEQRRQQGARAHPDRHRAAQFRAGLQGGAHEQGPRDVQHDRQGAARAGQLLQRRPALPAGGDGGRPGRPGHQRGPHHHREARRPGVSAMDLLVRGRYVITDAGARDAGVLTDSAVLVSGTRIAAVGDWRTLRRKHPRARAVGDGTQLLMPGLVDAHSHGRGLSPIQKGVLNDYLENNLIDWAFMPVFEPELTAALGAWRHIRAGCTTIHHMGFDTDGPQARGRCETAIRTYLDAGIRLAFAPGVRNVDKLVLDSKAFLATLPAELKALAEPLVHLDSERVEDEYFALFDHLHGRFASEDTRVLLSPSWAQACTERFLLRAKTTADQLGKVPIHMHCVQTPIQKAFSFRKYGKSAIAWLDDLGLVDENLTLGHAIWVTEEDIDRLATRHASVTSHPSCNLGMRNGLAPISVMHRRGVNVAMGLDDKTINDDEDAIMELRMLHKLHRVPDFDLRTPALDEIGRAH